MGKTAKNWLFDVLKEKDIKDLETGITKLGLALVEVREEIFVELDNEDSGLRNAMQVNLANGLQKLGKSAPEKKVRKKFFDMYPSYQRAVDHSAAIAASFIEKIISEFFPIEIEYWHARCEPVLVSHFAKYFEVAVPDKFTKVAKHVLKSVILDVFQRLRKKMKGLDVFSHNKLGDNAIIMAIKMIGKFEEEPDEQGETKGLADLWDMQCRNLVKLLSSAGAVEDPKIDSDATCQFGWNALIWAACQERCDMLEILLKSTADVNYRDRYGRTALYFAAEKGNVEAVQLLLDSGAKMHYKNQFGETAFSRAKKFSKTEVMELLKPKRKTESKK